MLMREKCRGFNNLLTHLSDKTNKKEEEGKKETITRTLHVDGNSILFRRRTFPSVEILHSIKFVVILFP